MCASTRARRVTLPQGHDDVTALLLAIYLENIDLLGVSSVHGNSSAYWTSKNAARCLHAFGAPNDVLVYPGAAKPLTRKVLYASDIHGEDGLGGVIGLLDPLSDELQSLYATRADGTPINALEGMAEAVRKAWDKGAGQQVTIVSCGPMTNIALFVSVYPDLLCAIEEFVFMGGGVGMGNRTSAAEFNIVCDPEACQIVLECDVKKVMMPLNVTHTAIVTKDLHCQLRSPDSSSPLKDEELPPSKTNLRNMLSTLIVFFAETYRTTFGFQEGPPLHDALTIAYVANPELFKTKRHRVDVELHGEHTAGETVVDMWDYRSCDDTWGVNGKNCLVVEAVEVNQFFDMLFKCIAECDKVSPLNH
ncbi:Inosine/uridine-preferring nucleoside hydrolase [Leucogyrophana mollusca]|uniref:Inosine/uridine-preferring nucleoside hydrolase n=1 Tax=Leucogyrophana mollusca TaxID=85980 RepID=A0ACB8BBG8_9AGAM|nr:Inosine/uridine-preferring nucleoside hydrolase [Leucogyrophana mollusca]